MRTSFSTSHLETSRGSSANDVAAPAVTQRTPTFVWGQFTTFYREWARRYLAEPTSWRIRGRPVCAFNNLFDFAVRYGRTMFAVMLAHGREIVRSEIGVDPFLLGIIGQANAHNITLASYLPLDGVTGYGLLPNWLGDPSQNYEELIEQRVAEWDQVQERLAIPFYPVVCAGWDASVRGEMRSAVKAADGYPYSPIVTGVTPRGFGRFLDHALAFNARWQPRENLVFLHAWNEWTEASVLEPSDRFGNSLLEEVQKRTRLREGRPAIGAPLTITSGRVADAVP
jgi:hypothetical protein